MAPADKDGKPAVVFYSAESARDAKGKSTPSALASSKVYDEMLNPVDNRMACFYARLSTLTRIDISNTTPAKDKLLNNRTVPLVVFYAPDGTYSSCLNSRMINERAFCASIARVLPGNPGELSAGARKFDAGLKALEALAKDHYTTMDKIKEARSKLAAQNKGSSASGNSVLEKTVEALARKESEIAAAMMEKKKELDVDLVSSK